MSQGNNIQMHDISTHIQPGREGFIKALILEGRHENDLSVWQQEIG